MTFFHCWYPEGGEEREHADMVEAMDAEHAAEILAERRDDDHMLTRDEDESMVIHVVDGPGVETRWRVRGVVTACYSGEQIEDEETQ